MNDKHPVVAVEVTYPFWMGGEMLDGYMCNDQQMAQITIDAAVDSAQILERQRIIKVLEESLDHDYGVPSKDGWSGKMLHVDVFCTVCRAVALIKGEQK